MSRWAHWFAVDGEEAERLTFAATLRGDEDVDRYLEPRLEEDDGPLHVSCDRMWEPIHRCLTGDHGAWGELDAEAGEYPLNLCVFGGALLRDGSDTASLISAKEVPELAAALDEITESELHERFFAIPDNQFHTIDEELFESTWEHFEMVRTFFNAAAEAGRAVVCTVSH